MTPTAVKAMLMAGWRPDASFSLLKRAHLKKLAFEPSRQEMSDVEEAQRGMGILPPRDEPMGPPAPLTTGRELPSQLQAASARYPRQAPDMPLALPRRFPPSEPNTNVGQMARQARGWSAPQSRQGPTPLLGLAGSSNQLAVRPAGGGSVSRMPGLAESMTANTGSFTQAPSFPPVSESLPESLPARVGLLSQKEPPLPPATPPPAALGGQQLADVQPGQTILPNSPAAAELSRQMRAASPAAPATRPVTPPSPSPSPGVQPAAREPGTLGDLTLASTRPGHPVKGKRFDPKQGPSRSPVSAAAAGGGKGGTPPPPVPPTASAAAAAGGTQGSGLRGWLSNLWGTSGGPSKGAKPGGAWRGAGYMAAGAGLGLLGKYLYDKLSNKPAAPIGPQVEMSPLEEEIARIGLQRRYFSHILQGVRGAYGAAPDPWGRGGY